MRQYTIPNSDGTRLYKVTVTPILPEPVHVQLTCSCPYFENFYEIRSNRGKEQSCKHTELVKANPYAPGIRRLVDA